MYETYLKQGGSEQPKKKKKKVSLVKLCQVSVNTEKTEVLMLISDKANLGQRSYLAQSRTVFNAKWYNAQ